MSISSDDFLDTAWCDTLDSLAREGLKTEPTYFESYNLKPRANMGTRVESSIGAPTATSKSSSLLLPVAAAAMTDISAAPQQFL